MKIIFADGKEIIIEPERVMRLIKRSATLQHMLENCDQGPVNIEDLEIPSKYNKPSDAAIQIFNDVIDCETVWDFILKYRFIKWRDFNPYYKKKPGFPKDIIAKCNACDEFMFIFNRYFVFPWFDDTYAQEVEEHSIVISLRYLLRGKEYIVTNPKYKVLVSEMQSYYPTEFYEVAENIPECTLFPYCEEPLYNEIFDSDDKLKELANAERGMPENPNSGFVSYCWDREFSYTLKNSGLTKLLFPFSYNYHDNPNFKGHTAKGIAECQYLNDYYYTFDLAEDIRFLNKKEKNKYKIFFSGKKITHYERIIREYELTYGDHTPAE